MLSTARLIDDIYGERPPRNAANALQSLVSRLRRNLGQDLIEFHPSGYRITVEPEQVDVHRFLRLTRQARQAMASGQPDTASKLFAEALRLWRGPADLPDPQAANPQPRIVGAHPGACSTTVVVNP